MARSASRAVSASLDAQAGAKQHHRTVTLGEWANASFNARSGSPADCKSPASTDELLNGEFSPRESVILTRGGRHYKYLQRTALGYSVHQRPKVSS
jgi:hypothetical protein